MIDHHAEIAASGIIVGQSALTITMEEELLQVTLAKVQQQPVLLSAVAIALRDLAMLRLLMRSLACETFFDPRCGRILHIGVVALTVTH